MSKRSRPWPFAGPLCACRAGAGFKFRYVECRDLRYVIGHPGGRRCTLRVRHCCSRSRTSPSGAGRVQPFFFRGSVGWSCFYTYKRPKGRPFVWGPRAESAVRAAGVAAVCAGLGLQSTKKTMPDQEDLDNSRHAPVGSCTCVTDVPLCIWVRCCLVFIVLFY